ncbi:hypothetical protein H0H81_004426 [Sphagnurus paluster]|uniref:P-loop containing nucleoside triphosphate hydrolase protein n=1 Tax=Sphagnurus paluster TaxID=117069 RepID=A0A9P7GNM7_9AGAR|nr:hypothetical protein H0H81_004426 [Sphagnurus paluster]
MDLEKFDELDQDLWQATKSTSFTPTEALEHLDRTWYISATRRARWMDLLGDYAGSESFVIDGESVLQNVLDDVLLAIGRDGEVSFQILHAYEILERTLEKFTARSAQIEIVFWKVNSHATMKTGEALFVVSSRVLARQLLLKHIDKLGLPVHTFESLTDPAWIHYNASKKASILNVPYIPTDVYPQPMFVMTNDGGVLDGIQPRLAAERTLMQRMFIYDLLSGGLPIALLRGAEYRDSKILSFVFEQSRDLHTRKDLTPALLEAIDSSSRRLDETKDDIFTQLDSRVPGTDVASPTKQDQYTDLLVQITRLLMQPGTTYPLELLPISSSIGASTFASVEQIWSNAGSAARIDLDHFVDQFLPQWVLPEVPTSPSPAQETFQLLPFDNEVFNSALSLVNAPVCDVAPVQHATHLDFGPGTLFSDTRHWHNQKAILPSHLGGVSPRPLDVRVQRRILRQNQRFMTTMQDQAATLTGAAGGILHQIVIVPVGSSNNTVSTAQPRHFQTQKPKKQPKLSSADKLRLKIAEEKTTRRMNESEIWWKQQLDLMAQLSTVQKIKQMEALSRNKRANERLIGGEMSLFRIHLQLLSWIDEPQAASASTRDTYTVAVMRMIKEMVDRRLITTTIRAALSTVLQALGFGPAYVTSMLVANDPDAPLQFKFVKLIRSKTKAPYHDFMHIVEHPVVWQLRLFGEYMDRSMDSAPDSRVYFQPDAWQRKVLDSIDANRSLLVVAPTSAGKTFISYYAMEKVLRESDDGILVYVAPTKALVTQIATEVYARFSKNLNGKSCWAIHTRDYRINDPQKCQILVTVPEMLAIMLLSPPLARVWTCRIKRIILDEIHSIGQQEGGAVWEQILLLAPCPIIGLSATIGSPEKFNDWLKSVQDAHGFEHDFIQFPHRYSHLRKFFYDLTRNPRAEFKDLVSHQPTARSRFLHPISLLDFGVRSLPPDLALEPRDTLSLYEALVLSSYANKEDVASLDPTAFFTSQSGLLTQKDILLYEAKLKDLVSKLIASPDAQSPNSPLYQVIRRLEDPAITLAGARLHTMPTRNAFRMNLIYLLADLNAQGELPAILFNFNRTDCEIMALQILTSLRRAEESWRSNNPEWQKKIRDWESWKLRSKERERLAEQSRRQKKDKDSEQNPGIEVSWESSFNPDDPSPQFSFIGTHTSYSNAQLDEDIRGMERWNVVSKWVLDALKRGIAIHHAGMNKRYRSLVESLFRQGFVRVVIATGTLALGINAPAKTSVFCGDSPFLTALQYRQCAGRAGRRGYDLLGNVIFYGLSMERVKRLVLSKLPSLGGNFPLTSTLAMRLLNLLEGSDNAAVAVNAYTEPSNFALVALCQQGVLHKICQQTSIISAQKDFIMLMAHLFGRRYLPQVYANKEYMELLSKKYPSRIILPPLPHAARTVLEERDQEILQIFVNCAVTHAKQQKKALGSDLILPLSKADYSGANTDSEAISSFRKHLAETAVAVNARSPFVANSGHGDNFVSIKELAETARAGLHLNEYAMPSMSAFLTHAEGDHVLNAYLYDFYIHGQVKTLAAANGIRRGDVWYLLQDFMLVLMTIKTALEQLLTSASKEGKHNDEANDNEDGVDVDSGYGTFDPAEADDGDGDADEASGFARPLEVTDDDWRVYKVVAGATAEFERKFKAMWA